MGSYSQGFFGSQEGIMFAYLVIGVELALLYAVFWYVFIREPKPYELRADHWGRYQCESGQFTAYGAHRYLPAQLIDEINERQLYNFYIEQIRLQQAQLRQIEFPQLPFPQPEVPEAQYGLAQPAPPSSLRRNRTPNLAPHLKARRSEQLRHGWVLSTEPEDEKPIIERFFTNLSRAINQLSLKTPLA
jgi:hypothetical protein